MLGSRGLCIARRFGHRAGMNQPFKMRDRGLFVDAPTASGVGRDEAPGQERQERSGQRTHQSPAPRTRHGYSPPDGRSSHDFEMGFGSESGIPIERYQAR